MTDQKTLSDTDSSETNDEFDAAFEELASKEPPAGDTPADPGDQGDQDPPPATDDVAGSDKPAAAEAPAGQQSDDDDIWKDAPPHLKAAFEKLQGDATHRETSLKGRLSYQDRELERLRQQLAPAPTADQAPSAEQAGSSVESDRLKKLREDYPEVAEPLLDVIADLTSKLEQVQQPVAEITQSRAEQAQAAQEALLNSTVPDWVELAKHEGFNDWVKDQPRALQEAVDRNWNAIADGKEAAWIFNQFRQHIGADPAPAADPKPADPTPSKTDQRRARQLDAGRDGGTSGGAPRASGIPDDFDAAVDANISSQRSRR